MVKSETFKTKPVSFDGKVSFKVNAYAASRVTGDMNVIDWNEYRRKWPHLRGIKFPLNAKRPMVDVLKGLDLICIAPSKRSEINLESQ